MAKPKKTPPSRKGGKYSFGSIALTLILLLIYWWSNGAQPEGNSATTPAPTTAAVATVRTLPTTAAVATATGAEATATTAAVDEAAVDEAAVDEAETAEPTDAIPTVDEPTDEPTEPPAATMVQATATALPLPTATKAAPPTATTAPKPTATPTQAARAGPPGMETITLDELPPEALDTIDLIDAGGPFPFDRDGVTFQNRERLLPSMPRGYYSEYTVITPGENDRGARRVIAGEDGELYYTDDHYDSFYWILLP